MSDDYRIDQRDQTIHGSQTNIGKADLVVIQESAKYAPPSPRQIPSPPRDFSGRDAELNELVSQFDRGATITGLRGMGGIGKTALAFKLVELLRDRYPDGHLMVNLQGTGEKPLAPADAMSQVIRSYHPTAQLPEAEAELANLYRSVLDGKCALLLLDNALDDRQVRPLLPPAGCGVIVTSRRKFTLPGLVSKDLDILKPDRAVELLLKVARPSSPSALPQEEKYWNEIARLCGFLPLALRAAGSMLANSPDLSLAKFAEDLRDERQRLERIGKEGVDLDVGASFGLSYNRLAQETARVFRILSIFPADFDAVAEEAICQDEGHRHLSEMLRWSLVEYQRPEEDDKGRYHLHDLVRIFSAGLLKVTDQADTQKRHAAYYQSALWKANELFLQGGKSLQSSLYIFDSELMNIRSGQLWATANSDMSSEIAEICSNFAWTGSILNLRLHPEEYMSWLEAALACAHQMENREAESDHMCNMGNAHAALGDARKAIKYYEKALTIYCETGDRRGEGSALGNLGVAHKNLGDACKAIEYYKQALAIDREIGDKLGEGNALGNLGNAYSILGYAQKAIEYYKQRLDIARMIGDKRGEGSALGNLGNAYSILGDAQKAIGYYEQALAIAREIGDRRIEAIWLGNLGNAYKDRDDVQEAIKYQEQALAIDREIGDRWIEANACWNLGLAYVKEGDLERAVDLMQVCIDFELEIGHLNAGKDAEYLEGVRTRLEKK